MKSGICEALLVVLVMIIVVTAAGCGSAAGTALSEFEQFVDSVVDKEAVTYANYHEFTPVGEYIKEAIPAGWIGYEIEIIDITYNVMEIDSLVSPFTATLTAYESKMLGGGRCATEQEARDAKRTHRETPPDVQWEAYYAYQNQHWVLTSAARTHTYYGTPVDYTDEESAWLNP